MIRNFTINMFDSKNQVIVFRSTDYEGVIEHTHDFTEIIYILGGEGIHMIRNREIPLKKGDIFVITTDDAHSIIPAGNAKEFVWINCVIDRKLTESVAIDVSPEQVFQTLNNKYIPMLIIDMEQEYQNRNLLHLYRLKNQYYRSIS